jgi:hypothetical protein
LERREKARGSLLIEIMLPRGVSHAVQRFVQVFQAARERGTP